PIIKIKLLIRILGFKFFFILFIILSIPLFHLVISSVEHYTTFINFSEISFLGKKIEFKAFFYYFEPFFITLLIYLVLIYFLIINFNKAYNSKITYYLQKLYQNKDKPYK